MPGITVRMNTTSEPAIVPASGLEAAADLEQAAALGVLAQLHGVTFEARQGRGNIWIVATIGGREVAALRAGPGGDPLTGVTRTDTEDGVVFEFASAIGALRTKVAFPADDSATVRCTTSIVPARDTAITHWPRDLHAFASAGTVHTSGRGLRSGVIFASADESVPATLFYLQDFSSLTEYFEATKRTPADSVGGTWPELGYAPPTGDDCVLPKSRETVVSDAYLTVRDDIPAGEGEIAAAYLDLLAATYACLSRPPVDYHDWPGRAAQTLRDLSLSPETSYVRRGKRYLKPYAGDDTKPPESMVQLTLAVNLDEYDRWRGSDSTLCAALRGTAATFFDRDAGTLVRWLPGEDFGESQAEDNMNHDDMDSWYLHHSLFNLSRLAVTEADAKDLFQRSLPFLMRVARRFAYRWPIFFNLRTLDIVRAESAPGKGGENDVAGLYALVMLHAHELFGDPEYLAEAERAVMHLRGLGFSLGYQMNTTGFAAEAALRLWKATGERVYLELSEICMANLFDNMWLWRCDYGHARHYRTFFGLFPLHDAPYLAAYEELEAHAKFHEFLQLGGDDVRPSLRLLLAEFQRYCLDRSWYYYPDTLPADVLADKPRNGRIRRELAIPLEDLQNGHETSGQVGQEIYGAGLAFVFASRHYVRLAGAACLAYCDYPMYDFQLAENGVSASWQAGGDPRGACELRVIPEDIDMAPLAVDVTTRAGDVVVPLKGRLTPEGHALFPMRGGMRVEIRWSAAADATQRAGIEIGGVARGTGATR